MRRMQAQLADDTELAARLPGCARGVSRRRSASGVVPEIDGVSAGGMPDRVKCLHVMVAHALAAGPGVNPFGDEALAMLADRGALPRISRACRGSDASESRRGDRLRHQLDPAAHRRLTTRTAEHAERRAPRDADRAAR